MPLSVRVPASPLAPSAIAIASCPGREPARARIRRIVWNLPVSSALTSRCAPPQCPPPAQRQGHLPRPSGDALFLYHLLGCGPAARASLAAGRLCFRQAGISDCFESVQTRCRFLRRALCRCRCTHRGGVDKRGGRTSSHQGSVWCARGARHVRWIFMLAIAHSERCGAQTLQPKRATPVVLLHRCRDALAPL